MPPPTTSSVVRTLLRGDIDMSADDVIQKAKSRGVTASPDSIRKIVHKLRGEVRKSLAKPAPAAARQTVSTLPAPAAARQTASPPPAPASAPPPSKLTGVFATVSQVNAVVGVVGGVDQARQAAEAVRACGSVEAFLQHLDLVAGIKTT